MHLIEPPNTHILGRVRKKAIVSSNGPTTALLYTRVSGDEQAREGLSLPAQLADCRRYVRAQNWILGHEFEDVMSGKRDDRPQYQAMLTEVRRLRASGHAVVVVVKWLHRLGRRVLERARSWEELDMLGVRVHSVAEGGQVSKLVADVLAAVAEEESRQIGDRVSSTWKHVTALGWAKTTKAPWGYRWRPATEAERAAGSPKSVLDVNPEAAEYVTLTFEKVAGGESARSVARWIQQLPLAARGGRKISWRTLQDVLRRSVYAGRPVQGIPDVLYRPAARWPALVPDSVWMAVQLRLDSHKRIGHQATGRYLLTGLLRCVKCQGRMRGTSSANGLRYRCGSDYQVRCYETADRGRVDRLVLGEVGAVLARFKLLDSSGVVARKWAQLQVPDEQAPAKHIQRLQSQADRARQRITRATDLLVDGAIDRAAYNDLVGRAQTDIAHAESELALAVRANGPARPHLPPLSRVVSEVAEWSTALADEDVIVQRELIAKLLDQVVAVREKSRVYRVEIVWTPLGQALQSLGL
jgi:DNA invertase Pin-like site-specific DNA recombinase